MATMTKQELATAMGKIDFAMLTTRTEGGQLATRPMSNNGEVGTDGDSYYFSWDSARTVGDILADPKVALSFQGSAGQGSAGQGSAGQGSAGQGSAGLSGKPPLFVAVEGSARIVRDKAEFARHWTRDLERWFADGIETEGMVMIHVHADRIHYWDGQDEGEVTG